MPIDERRRLQLAEDAKRALGDESGVTLMEMLPPVGWADVATRLDLVALGQRFDAKLEAVELRLEARMERGFRQVLVTVSALVVSGFAASIVASLAR